MNRENFIINCCTGCGLCHSTMSTTIKYDEKGFIIPQIDSNTQYEKICPVFYYMNKNKDFKLWGNYIDVYEGYSTDEYIRYSASSGGALTALSMYLLESGTVNGIIHTGISKENPIKTVTYVSRSREEVISHMGSRYSISAPLMDIVSLLRPDEKYAFIGKPCDITALKQYCRNIKDLGNTIVFTMSFFCAGMPSNRANKELLASLGCDISNLSSLQYRGNGWPGYTTAVDKNGRQYKMTYQKAWGSYLGRDIKKICRYCMDGIGESADIACADFWYLDKNDNPDFSEHNGRNIIFARNDKANLVLQSAAKLGFLNIANRNDIMNHFEMYQPNHFTRRVTMKYQLLALKIFGRFAPKYSRRYLNQANKFSNIKINYKIFIGTIKRILQGKL